MQNLSHSASLQAWENNAPSKSGIKHLGIECFSNASGPLALLPPHVAVSRYGGDREEAENALLRVFLLTNKGLAHSTSDMIDDPTDFDLIEIASRGVPSLMQSYFYTPMGLPQPHLRISVRDRE
ncbi:hypothetical protein G6L28_07860 [Agrobacterium larrymoorei]|nr:hypothetical protein [Agrobacterium larrymoorei]